MLYFISIIFWGEENLSMFSSNLFKKTIIMTIIVTLGSYFLPAVIKPSVSGYSVLSGTVSADTTSVSDITDGLSNQEKTDVSTTLTESKDIDINTMDVSTQQAFKKIVWNAAESLDLPSEADTNDAYIQLLGIFDSTSENYNNLSEATSNLIDDIDSNHQSSFDFISGSDVLAAQHGTVSVRLLGSTFNILIAGITGGPLSSYVRCRGFSALAAALESRLAATIHSNQFGYLIKGSVGAMVKFADPGLYLAQVIDQHDKIRNNGWIEAW